MPYNILHVSYMHASAGGPLPALILFGAKMEKVF